MLFRSGNARSVTSAFAKFSRRDEEKTEGFVFLMTTTLVTRLRRCPESTVRQLSVAETIREQTERAADPRVDLAVKRTERAWDRTLLAWLRTTSGLIAAESHSTKERNGCMQRRLSPELHWFAADIWTVYRSPLPVPCCFSSCVRNTGETCVSWRPLRAPGPAG